MTKRWLMGSGAAAAVALAAGCAGGTMPRKATGEVLLSVQGQAKDGPYELGRADLAKLPRAGFRARPPGAPEEARFDGVSLLKLLEFDLQLADGADTLVFVTRDGVAVPLTRALIRQYGPILALEVDGTPSPPRLVWPNLDQRGLDADPRASSWWTGPLERIEVVTWDKTWGRVLRAPPGSSDEARHGAGHFLTRCAACHRKHGVGGQRGPALDGVAARLGPAGVVAAVQRHPGWPARVGVELAPSEAVAGQVAAFLAVSDQAGVAPVDDEVKPPPRPVRPGGP